MMRARNWRVRGSVGSPSTRSGGPDSGLDPTAALAAMTDAFAG